MSSTRPKSQPRVAHLPRRGLMLILSSPSGAGKTTLTRMLMQERPLDLSLSVSVTTRERRSSEIEGIHYHFISRAAFDAMRERGDLLESAEVHGHGYGTPRHPAETILTSGRDVLFDIDYQGTAQLRDKAPNDVVTLFILPPSMAELKGRLDRRAEDEPAQIAGRLANARHEIEHWRLYDYVLINEDIAGCYGDILKILAAERLKRIRCEPALTSFVGKLLRE
jgi:guanylate kinase